MEIKELKKKDHKKVIQYAIKGMHFNLYLKNKFLLYAYGKYFWYLEYTNASQIIAAYEGDKLLGVIIVDMKNEAKPYKSFWKTCYIKLIDQSRSFSLRVVLWHITKQIKKCLKNILKNTPLTERFAF